MLAEFPLTVGDFDVLASLRRRAGEGTVNVKDLQRWLMLCSGGMTKWLDRLERGGLPKRLPDPADRRGVLIRLSPPGRDVIDRALPALTVFGSALVRQAIGSPQLRARWSTGCAACSSTGAR